ncbi:MAG: signal peptidase [Clostridiales bacterium]|nr:signal peptidase [Clostridiales bacterium]
MEKDSFDTQANRDDNSIEPEKKFMEISQNKDFNIKKEILEWVQAIVIAFVIALLIRTFVFSLIRVQGYSMIPTLQHNDRLIVTKLMYKPKQGDIIILRPPMHKNTYYVKRVIAVSGQTVDIDFKKHIVYVDGKALIENYVNEPIAQPGDIQFPRTVPENTVFVLGDNRNDSRDSRYSDIGMVPYQSIIGKAIFRIWPINKLGSVYK